MVLVGGRMRVVWSLREYQKRSAANHRRTWVTRFCSVKDCENTVLPGTTSKCATHIMKRRLYDRKRNDCEANGSKAYFPDFMVEELTA